MAGPFPSITDYYDTDFFESNPDSASSFGDSNKPAKYKIGSASKAERAGDGSGQMAGVGATNSNGQQAGSGSQ